MSAPLIPRAALPLLRCRLKHCGISAGFLNLIQRPLSTASDPTRSEEDTRNAEKTTAVSCAREPAKYGSWGETDYRKWKEKEEEIMRDVEPILSLTKDILHSDRYLDGERLSIEDEKAVVEKLLVYHPNCDDKVGCGLDCIMVDRHPQFRHSRCLFVVRTDGGWIDFSYQKCLRAYVREKYPSHAERFIREHFKRGS